MCIIDKERACIGFHTSIHGITNHLNCNTVFAWLIIILDG